MEAFNSQVHFLIEIDKLKSVFRQSLLINQSRTESTAEHSWHLAMAVMILEPYSNHTNMDMFKAVRMALIHDIVEIDAGDTFAYDIKANEDKKVREDLAAERIYSLLNNTSSDELKSLWREFEERQTPEAQYVDAVDRFLPILNNYLTQGRQWRAHGVTSKMVLTRNSPIKEGSLYLWDLVKKMVEDALLQKYLPE